MIENTSLFARLHLEELEDRRLLAAGPMVTSIDAASPSPTRLSTVHYLVQFNSQITGLDVTDFSLATTGALSGAAVTSIADNGGNQYDVTVSTGNSGSGSIELDLIDDNSIKDSMGNPLVGPNGPDGSFNGPLIVIDRTAPTALSITQADPNPTKASTVRYTVTFSEAVQHVDSSDFTLTTAGTIAGASVVGVATVSASVYTVTVNTGGAAQSGSVALNLVDNDTITDAAGNVLGGSGLDNGDLSGVPYTIDKLTPTIASITRSDPNPNNTSTVHFNVAFSENVTGVDISDFIANSSGLTGASISGVTGSGSNYVVTASTGSGNSGSLELDVLDNDTILNIVGTPLNGLGSGNVIAGLTSAYTIDKVPPTVLQITTSDPNPTNQEVLHYGVAFSEPVTGVDITDFTLSSSAGLFGAAITSISGSGASYVVTVDDGIEGSGSLHLNLVDNNSIRDQATNPLAGGGTLDGSASGPDYLVDRANPAVASIVATDANTNRLSTVHFTVTFSKAVTGVDASDFVLATTGITGASIANVTGSGSSYIVTVNTGSQSGTLGLNVVDDDSIVDEVKNPLGGVGPDNGDVTGPTYTLDRTRPVVNSIVLADANPTNAAVVDFTVQFSENVTGVSAGDFQLATTGLASAAITNVSGSGSTYTVTVNDGTGNGTLGLNVINDGSISDQVGNTLLTGLTGPAYTVDRTGPAVSTVAPITSNPTSGATAQFGVVFTESVTGVDATDFALMSSGVTGASITNVSGSGSLYVVTVNTGSGNGTLQLNVIDDDSIQDSLNRPLGGPGAGNGGFSGQSLAIDKSAPFAISITPTDPTITNTDQVHYVVRFNEPVGGVDPSDFGLTVDSLTGVQVASVSGSGSIYTVTVDTGSGDGTLWLNLLDDDSITDPAGNPLGGIGADNGDFPGASYVIDKQAPTVSSVTLADSSPTAAFTVQYTVTFSEPVTGVNITDFALAATAVRNAVITGVSGSGTTYTVTANTGLGNGTLQLNVVDDDSILDIAGNPLSGVGVGNGDFSGSSYTINKGAPRVLSVVLADPNPTAADTVHYTVTFSDRVTGVDTSDFSLVASSGVTGATVTAVSGSGSTYQVTVDTGTGDGTLGLDTIDDDSITDAVGNPLGGAGTDNGNFVGQVYSIDKVTPPIPTPWRNSHLHLDVNNDGLVQPIDALLVIHQLSVDGIGALADPGSENPPTTFYDTNGDNVLSPADALMIINRLLTPPKVVLDTLVPFTPDLTPVVTVTATSDAGIGNDTAVSIDIDLNGDGNFSGPGESDRSLGSMYNGSATFELNPALTPDNPSVGPYQINMRAHVVDADGVEGFSPIVPLVVDTMTSDALKNYVDQPDATYSYSLANTIVDPSGTFVDYILNMKSQTWRSTADVNDPVWQHWVQIIVPTGAIGTTALLLIDGGGNGAAPSSPNAALTAEAVATHTVCVDVPEIPNEPLTFAGDPNDPRTEDAIIAYSFDQFMDHIGDPGNSTWPVLEAMVKAVVRGMDTVQSFVPTVTDGSQINDFVLTGYSKRGWTTWLTAAVDDRIKAIIPGVFDNLNTGTEMVHHYGVYGFFSPAIQDYNNLNIFGRLETPEGEQLSEIIDPYYYLDNGHFNIPKLMIDSAGDQFFVSDSAQFYFHDLPGDDNYIRYLPNTDHSLDERAAQSTATFYNAVLNNLPLPKFSWTVEPDGSIRVQTETAPSQVLLWQITNPTARDFRKDYISPSLVWTSSPLSSPGGGIYVGSTPMPTSGATAFFVELTFPSPIPGNPYVFTTEIHVNTLLPLTPWPFPSGLNVQVPTANPDLASPDLNAAASALAADVTAPSAPASALGSGGAPPVNSAAASPAAAPAGPPATASSDGIAVGSTATPSAADSASVDLIFSDDLDEILV